MPPKSRSAAAAGSAKSGATKKAAAVKSTGKVAAKPALQASPAKKQTRTKTTPTKSAPVPKTNGKKRGIEETDDEEEEEEDEDDEQSQEDAPQQEGPPRKKPKTYFASLDRRTYGPGPAKTLDTRRKPQRSGGGSRKERPIINEPPTKRLDVFVFGEGSSGELGLGSKKYDGRKPIDVKRPRINHNLDAEKVGIVQIACGGMHVVALTHDQKILTWGVNDDKALGRDTTWSGGTRDIDAESDDGDDDDTGINPNESTPGEVNLQAFPEGTVFAQVAATDSASFVLTNTGLVYGWGTFRGSDGIIGFADGVRVQPTPTLIPGLDRIKQLACGSNHVVALDVNGKVFTWGSGGQFQLGRKPLSRLGGPQAGLRPQPCGKFGKKHFAHKVAAGSYHSFYIDNEGQVWAWGLNNYSQTGLYDDTGKDDAMVLHPKIVESLEDLKIGTIVGGEHHSVACTEDGKLLTWGRVDGHQVGQPSDLYNEDNAVFDDSHKPRILLQPTQIQDIKATFVAAGTDTSFAIDDSGKVYSWGFSANYQTGQGTTDDIEVPTHIDNTALRGRKIIWAGAGGQYSIVAAEHGDNLPNGR